MWKLSYVCVLAKKLDAIDQAYPNVTPENSIAEFIERYIARVNGGPSAVKLDNALFAGINDDAGLAELMNRCQSDKVDRYVEVLETAGSTCSRHDLRGAANYLASIASHFEQNLEKHRHGGRTQLMQKMVQDTLIAIALYPQASKRRKARSLDLSLWLTPYDRSWSEMKPCQFWRKAQPREKLKGL